MKKALVLACAAWLVTSLANAQTWQWGKRGGSPFNPFSGTNAYNQEMVYDMATDRNGNVYFVSPINSSLATLGTTAITTYGTDNTNLLIASYSCSGALRWHKVIGGNGGCSVISLRTDSTGHVYVMGNLPQNDATNFSSDTTLPNTLAKRLFIVQYDTSGNYQWLRQPDADTVTAGYGGSYAKTAGFDMEVDASGNLNVVAFLSKGALPNTAYTVTVNGLYILKYNSAGTLLSATKPPGFDFATFVSANPSYNGFANVDFNPFRIARMSNGNWIIAGTQADPVAAPGFSINGINITHELFVACFNSQWQYQWHYMSDTTLNGILGRPAIDNSNSIYLTGYDYNHTKLFGISIPVISSGTMPFIAKLNSSGVAQWLSFASDNRIAGGCSAATNGEAVALTQGGEAVITGGCGGLKWGAKQINGACNTGYTAFVGRFNTTTGTCNALDTIRKQGGGGGNFGMAIAAGKGNTVYVGGQTKGNQIAGTDTMVYAGGTSDFFIAKYGYPCYCTSIPSASYTKSITAKTATLTYNGTTANVDSVAWTFGDGQGVTKTGAALTAILTHTYTTAGTTYAVCATAYSQCGNSQSCQNITITSSGAVNNIAGQDVKVYPNPANDYLTIEGMSAGSEARVLSIFGQQVMSSVITGNKYVLNISGLPTGTYMLVLTAADGSSGTVRISKE